MDTTTASQTNPDSLTAHIQEHNLTTQEGPGVKTEWGVNLARGRSWLTCPLVHVPLPLRSHFVRQINAEIGLESQVRLKTLEPGLVLVLGALRLAGTSAASPPRLV